MTPNDPAPPPPVPVKQIGRCPFYVDAVNLLAYLAARKGAAATAADLVQLVTGVRALADALELRAAHEGAPR
jgi:hypothetical protein